MVCAQCRWLLWLQSLSLLMKFLHLHLGLHNRLISLFLIAAPWSWFVCILSHLSASRSGVQWQLVTTILGAFCGWWKPRACGSCYRRWCILSRQRSLMVIMLYCCGHTWAMRLICVGSFPWPHVFVQSKVWSKGRAQALDATAEDLEPLTVARATWLDFCARKECI